MLIIAIVSVFAAGLTFFSGFGLGTILLPVFSLFFPITTAIAATALVHFANNVFKFGLLYKYIHFKTAAYFGLPAILAAILGGFVLIQLGKPIPLYFYSIRSYEFSISGLKIIIGCLLIFFAVFELNERLKNYTFPPKYLWVGGVLSGFFGGLSGHQGAFRSAFLAKSGLTKQQFVATSNVIALVIDISRLIVYSSMMIFVFNPESNNLIFCAIISAILGSYVGKKLLNKTTLEGVQKTVGILLLLMGFLLIVGII